MRTSVSPFHVPNMFSHVSKPTPLKKAFCKSLLLSIDHRLQICDRCRCLHASQVKDAHNQ